jgi:hypothetical protein
MLQEANEQMKLLRMQVEDSEATSQQAIAAKSSLEAKVSDLQLDNDNKSRDLSMLRQGSILQNSISAFSD